jgi:transcriptional regulator with XRE-family HTH domain
MQADSSPPHQAAPPRGRPPNQLDSSSSAAARFGAELRALRLGAGLTITALAKQIGFSTTRISEVENGKGKLSREFVEACERALPAEDALMILFDVVIHEEAAERHTKLAARRGRSTAEPSSALAVQSSEVGAGHVPASQAPILVHREVGTANRRDVLRVGGTLAGAVLSGKLLELLGTEPLAMIRALRTATVDAAELDYHEATAARYMIDYEASGPLPLLAPVLELFHGVRRLVEDRQPIASQRRLYRVGAKLATLLGIFAYDDQARARAWFHVAQRAAQEADDNVLGAWALVKESLLPTYGGDPSEALDLLGEGADLAGRSPSVVTAMVAASEARAHAIGRDEAAALAALERAEQALDRAPPGERRLFAFADAQLAFYRTSCHVGSVAGRFVW